jgi:hypothetical protein
LFFPQFINNISINQYMVCPLSSHFSLFSWTFLIGYSKSEFKSNGYKVSSYSSSFIYMKCIRKLFTYIGFTICLFKRILISLRSSTIIQISVRQLCNTSLLAETKQHLNLKNSKLFTHCATIFSPVPDKCRLSGQYRANSFQNPHWWYKIILCACVITKKEEFWIKFCM